MPNDGIYVELREESMRGLIPGVGDARRPVDRLAAR